MRAPGKRAAGKPAAQDLSQHGKIGRDAGRILRSAGRNAEPGDRLVEESERAPFARGMGDGA